MMNRLLILLCILTGFTYILSACDMSAIITKQGVSLSNYQTSLGDTNYSDFSSPVDYLTYVMSTSSATDNNDGYGMLYYPQNVHQITEENYWFKYVTTPGTVNQVFYTGNYFNRANRADIFDKAIDATFDRTADAAIVMCHARNASANPFAPGNHPFRMNINNRTYTFMHNGFVSTDARTYMINEINLANNLWFDLHKPNYHNFTNAAYPAGWIDSEVLFNYLMFNIETCNFNVVAGLAQALVNLEQYMRLSTNVVNFVFSDGQSLYVFKSTPLSGSNSGYRLSFKNVDDKFYAIRTGAPTSQESAVMPFELIVFSKDNKLHRYPNFTRQGFETGILTDTGNNPQRSISPRPELISRQMDVNITFNLQYATNIKLRIYNSKGQLIRRLADRYVSKGVQTFNWNGLTDKGRYASGGIYFMEVQYGKQRAIHKILYLR